MKVIGGIPREKIIDFSEKIIEATFKLDTEYRRKTIGAYLAIAVNKLIPLKLELGETPADLFDFLETTYETGDNNILYLRSNPSMVSSWGGHHPMYQVTGGAIRTAGGTEIGKNIIISCTGVVEVSHHISEAISLTLSLACRWCDLSHARKVIEISENPFLDPLIKAAAKYNIFN